MSLFLVSLSTFLVGVVVGDVFGAKVLKEVKAELASVKADIISAIEGLLKKL
jgi:hypothetical protein